MSRQVLQPGHAQESDGDEVGAGSEAPGKARKPYEFGVKPSTAVVDMGYRGVDEDVPAVQVIHRGKAKRLTAKHKTWLRRRQAVEPTTRWTAAG